MNKVKFNDAEQYIMNAIAEKGEYTWSVSPLDKSKKEIEKALKSLHWMELIKRKPTYGNVFIATEMGSHAIRINKAADILNN